MTGLVPQETAEYYKWLIRIERAEFEKELLDIVIFFFLQGTVILIFND